MVGWVSGDMDHDVIGLGNMGHSGVDGYVTGLGGLGCDGMGHVSIDHSGIHGGCMGRDDHGGKGHNGMGHGRGMHCCGMVQI